VSELKVLLLDIETKPPLLYAWPPLWDLKAGVEQVVERGRMICFAAKWLDEKRIRFHSEYQDGHSGMVEAIRDLLEEADIVCHFNGQSFDEKHIQTEIWLEKLDRPSPFQRWDLKKIVAKEFRLDSNKLAYVSRMLDIGEKLKHEGWALWQGWIDQDPKYIRIMERYNRKDVALLEDLLHELTQYLPIRIPGPLLADGVAGAVGEVCPECGSVHREKRGFHYTTQSKFQRYRCLDCGRYYRDTRRVAGITTKGI
jgi:hypothetical protein